MKAVIFDMDGVIIDSQSIADKLLAQTAAKFGVKLSQEELHKLHGISFPAFWEYVKETYHLPKSAEYYGKHYDVEEEIRMYKDLLPIKGIPELIKDLKKHEIKLALASSASRYRIQKVLALFHLHDTFEATISYQDVKHAKPDPEIFLNAASKLKVKPEECIVIEDAINGLEAATRAGMKCVLFWHKKKKIKMSFKPTLLLDDLSKIDFVTLTII